MFAEGFGRFAAAATAVVAATLPDLLVMAGAVLVVWGVHMWSVPAAFVVGGVLMILGGVVATGKK